MTVQFDFHTFSAYSIASFESLKEEPFFFFFASALEMASQCPVVGQLNQRFLKMASLTSIITKFT